MAAGADAFPPAARCRFLSRFCLCLIFSFCSWLGVQCGWRGAVGAGGGPAGEVLVAGPGAGDLDRSSVSRDALREGLGNAPSLVDALVRSPDRIPALRRGCTSFSSSSLSHSLLWSLSAVVSVCLMVALATKTESFIHCHHC